MKKNDFITFGASLLTSLLLAILFFNSRGLFGLEHLLSSWQVSQGLRPYIDFFEHHGPLQYYFFAPLVKIIGLKNFPIFIAVFNSLLFAKISVLITNDLLPALKKAILWIAFFHTGFPFGFH